MIAPSVVVYLVLCGVIAYWATRWKRNGVGWFLLALLISPLITAVILIIGGSRAR